MDPNANLNEQILIAKDIHRAFETRRPIDNEDVDRLAELVLSMHEWITSGGFLPVRWDKQHGK